ncbi:uncharacterized protein [Miscanthus floridulus]|uniref:uncharacterized protein n=1 Tax=Miscanthus floridulus TaxID=154761 RepID=UPI003459D2F4
MGRASSSVSFDTSAPREVYSDPTVHTKIQEYTSKAFNLFFPDLTRDPRPSRRRTSAATSSRPISRTRRRCLAKSPPYLAPAQPCPSPSHRRSLAAPRLPSRAPPRRALATRRRSPASRYRAPRRCPAPPSARRSQAPPQPSLALPSPAPLSRATICPSQPSAAELRPCLASAQHLAGHLAPKLAAPSVPRLPIFAALARSSHWLVRQNLVLQN